MATDEEHFGMRTTETLFENIDGGQAITEIESLCMNCEENVDGIKTGHH
jgi:D-alanyl-D-alanine carboxypeptidase